MHVIPTVNTRMEGLVRLCLYQEHNRETFHQCGLVETEERDGKGGQSEVSWRSEIRSPVCAPAYSAQKSINIFKELIITGGGLAERFRVKSEETKWGAIMAHANLV